MTEKYPKRFEVMIPTDKLVLLVKISEKRYVVARKRKKIFNFYNQIAWKMSNIYKVLWHKKNLQNTSKNTSCDTKHKKIFSTQAGSSSTRVLCRGHDSGHSGAAVV